MLRETYICSVAARQCGGNGGVGGDFDGGGAPLALEEDPPPLGLIPDPLGVPLS
jgi:hypothetical protein